jgi:hypothetical protein
MAATDFHGGRPDTAPSEERAQPPIRWPHPQRIYLVTIALWGLGLLVALVIPASIVPPGQATAAPGPAWTAFTFTVIGALVMMGATVWAWRRTKDSGLLILGLIPGSTVIIGGIILVTAKILGSA